MKGVPLGGQSVDIAVLNELMFVDMFMHAAGYC